MEHPNMGIKTPSKRKTQSDTKPKAPPRCSAIIYAWMPESSLGAKGPTPALSIIYAWTPKSSPGVKSSNTCSPHGPTPRCGSSEASQAAEQPSPRPRSPCRGSWQHATSPPHQRVRGHPRSAGELRLARGPLGGALRGASARGEFRLIRDCPSADWGFIPTTQRG